ncbi:hypothetical protein JCM17845_16040 [Iodidimonas gelatinilytica]|uniref:DUF1223 domain-containing protein n=1 Tax=Iodidimonas gelatinilytica TaxID=1236966 RepID=A0A5A7MY34_9PROT|nr:hypothetical protein JCM17845_16040 [Iodidimonas gelatinilytica]
MFKRIIISAFLLFALPVHAEDRLTVVELFSSQSCPNCPPAHEFLAELAGEKEILALSWPVDYWNYLGWADSFAQADFTHYQRAYNEQMGEPGVYTPQMIIDGRFQTVGSRRKDVVHHIARARDLPRADLDLSIRQKDETCIIALPQQLAGAENVHVTAVFYSARASVSIPEGENRGKTLEYDNLVRHTEKLGLWTGEGKTFEVHVADAAQSGADHLAILLHADGENGPIIGAARIALSTSNS